ncbi:MAG: response regulator transcription factor [Candidatus Omnitrophica bacterium]|nr:response regulator transcription factor [Candidatus Omnitrophota bacterium]MCM8776671.1 response regulator transcription factor [Candidatus Omnitrophota bacterium]
MKEKIAILEDEKDILELIALHLGKDGYRVEKFSKVDDFFKSATKESFDLLVLDLILPDMDGIEVCKQIKANPELSSLPIIMVTAKTELADKIVGLEVGADDYITKPFSPKELVARVKAVLRRYSQKPDGDKIVIGNILRIEPAKREVYVEDKKIDLTFAEFGILQILASKKGWVFSREKIIDILWEGEKVVIDRTIDVHVKTLREKLGKAKKFIKTVRGVGYKIEE